MCAKLLELCLTLLTLDCSLPGSSVHGLLQAEMLEWVAVPSSRGPARPRDWTCIFRVSGIGGGSLPLAPPEELSQWSQDINTHASFPTIPFPGLSPLGRSEETGIGAFLDLSHGASPPWRSSVLLGSLMQLDHLFLCSLSGPHILLARHQTCPGHSSERMASRLQMGLGGPERGPDLPEATQRISDDSRAKTGVSCLTALPQLLSPACVFPAAPSTELGTPRPLGNLPREVMWVMVNHVGFENPSTRD